MRMHPVAAAPVGWPALLFGLCVAAALLSAMLVRAMRRVAVLDIPGHRSAHARPTPKGGGVGPVAVFVLGLPLAGLLQGAHEPAPGWTQAAWAQAGCLAGAVAMLAWFSWLDDVRQFPPILKLAAQAAAAALVLFGIGPIPGLGDGSAPDHALGLLGGFIWLLFVTNALNFIDGLDGLAAGGMALTALFLGLTSAWGLQNSAGCLLAAGLLGFLPSNLPVARIFLGDVGSQGAGLALASLGLLRWRDAPGALIAPLLLGGILYDVAFTLCRRLLAGERVMQAHRGHLYQVAFRCGVPATLVTLLHWGFVSWGGLVGLALRAGLIGPLGALVLVLGVQVGWTAWVVRRARRFGLERW